MGASGGRALARPIADCGFLTILDIGEVLLTFHLSPVTNHPPSRHILSNRICVYFRTGFPLLIHGDSKLSALNSMLFDQRDEAGHLGRYAILRHYSQYIVFANRLDRVRKQQAIDHLTT